MKVGAAQVEITPDVGVELSGFAARVQPCVGVLDPLYARCLYLEDGDERLLWVGADVIAFEQEFIARFRAWAERALGLAAHQVLICATHTHSGPGTVELTGAGRKSEAYVRALDSLVREASRRSAMIAEEAELVVVQAPREISIDRRKKASADVDPLVTALGWRRADGTFAAAALNYAMHPVALGAVNRLVSADWCGAAAEKLREELPGRPIVLVSNGAAGNLNPPGEGVAPEVVRGYGERVVEGLAEMLEKAVPGEQMMRVEHDVVIMPLEVLSAQEIDAYADKWRAKIEPGSAWEKPFALAIDTWSRTMKANRISEFEVELYAVRLGAMRMIAINGEIFSKFSQRVRDDVRARVFVVAYANGVFGYIATREAYAEGGYEVDTAHFFYNSFRPRIGTLEMLAERAVELIVKCG